MYPDPEAEEADEDDEEQDEYQSYFVGSCTCLHEPEQHGWGRCSTGNCTCQAGWEE